MTRNQSALCQQPLIELSIRQFLVWSLMLGMCLQTLAPAVVLAAESRRGPGSTSKKQDEKPGATIVGIEPGRVTQGQAVTVTVRGKKTKWAKGKTQVSLGDEVSVGGAPAGMPGPAQVVSKKLMQLQIQVEGKASLGIRKMRVVTGNDIQEVETALTVVPTQLPGAGSTTVSTFAGMAGESGFADGETSEARFNRPTGMAVGPDEAIYVADTGNHRIRRVDAFGKVTTLAGSGVSGFGDGTGPEAQFNEPQGVTVDAGGYVYVADTNNHRIRKIDPFGAVTTITGTGVAGLKDGPANEAQFDRPVGITLDPGGQLYIADAGNESIRRIGLDGVVTTVAGNGVGENPVQLKGLAGIAVERETVLVYLADQGRILRLDAEGNLLTVAGSGRGFSDGNGADARFAEPAGLALDTTGTLIVADTANSLIREVLPEAAVRGDSLAVTTLAGTGERGTTDGPGQTAQFSQPRGIAVLSSSAIIVADSGNHVLRKLVRPPVVEDFTPDRAAQAETIKLKGRQFDGRGPGYNAVDFARETGGRTPATVTAATATELTVVVPDDAATGKVRVQTGGGLGESRREFQLGAPAGPVVMDFRPRFGPAGTLVTVTGKALRAGNEIPMVTFLGTNGSRLPGRVMAATPGEVQVLVPDGAQTGVIEVTSAGAMGRSRDMFQVDGFGYRLVGVPNTAFVLDGSETAFVIHVNAGGELFQSLVELKLKEAPQGVTATFDRKWITAGATATLKVAVAKGKLLPGSYKLTVEGEAAVGGGMVRREVELTLQVKPLLRTALTGRVLSTEMEPIPGATVSLDGRSATTDGAGMFLLEGIEAGQNRPVMVDGRTATAPNRTYPVIVEPATVIFNRANTVPYTFFLPAIDTQYEVPVAPGQETVVTTPRVPGLKLTIPAEANLRNRDGSPVTRVSLTPVAIDRTPAPLPANLRATLVFTAQPGGADTDVPLPVSFPNLTQEQPGTQCDLWNFNHDSAQWEVYGTGHVSPDGRTIEPDINPSTGKPFGLPYFSWFTDAPGGPDDKGPGPGGPYPDGSGDPANCPSCSGDDPVNFATGEKVETETDVAWGGARGGLSLTRTHINNRFLGRFGMGWTDNFSTRLFRARDELSATIFVTGREGSWLFSLDRVETIEDAAEPVKIYVNRFEAGTLGDELRIVPEIRKDGRIEPTYGEYRNAGGQRIRFDALGRLESLTDRNGNRTSLTYDDQGRLVKVTDPVGRSLLIGYRSQTSPTPAARNLVETITDPLGRMWTYLYAVDRGDALNPDLNTLNLEGVRDPLGHTLRYEYTPIQFGTTGPIDTGRLKRIIDKRGNVVKDIEYEGLTTRVVSQRFADGGIERYNYTVSGGQVTGVTIKDPMGRVTSRRFNTAGYVIETTDELGQVRRVEREIGTNLPMATIGADGAMENRQIYDPRGNATEMTDELGHSSRMEYEPVFNNPTKIVDKLGHETWMEYDERGNQTAMINALGEITRWEYDQFGQVIGMTDGLGHTSRMEYDQYGNVIAQIDPLGNRTTFEFNQLRWQTATIDAEGRRVEQTYDELGRVASLIDANKATTRYEYDQNGNQINLINALAQQWLTVVDSKNRAIKQVDPLGRETQVEYNFNNELTGIIFPSGKTLRYSYSQRGQCNVIFGPQNNKVQLEYNFDQNLIMLQDQRGNITRIQYDEMNRPIQMYNPLGHKIQMGYDSENNMNKIIDRLGRATTVAFDKLNRPVTIQYPDATVQYKYDATGNRVQLIDTMGGTLRWTYDDANRLLFAVTEEGTIEYGYNKANDRILLKVTNQLPVTYSYDQAGRMQTIDQGNKKISFSYDILSRLVGISRSNSVVTSYTYDEVDRLTGLRHTKGQSQVIEDFQYTYTLDDEIASQTSLFSPITLPSQKTVSAADQTNRIKSINTGSYFYDEVGQVSNISDIFGSTKLEWDSRGRLIKTTLPDNRIITYKYDALGRRTRQTLDNTDTVFLYDGDEIVQDQINGLIVNYLNGPGTDQKLIQTTAQEDLYFIEDHLGSTIALTDASGSVVGRSLYEPFGQMTGNLSTRFGFSGREGDSLAKLMYYRTRWYDPMQGRFLSEDKYGFTGGFNFYTYVDNNPISFVDPYGLNKIHDLPGNYGAGNKPLSHFCNLATPPTGVDLKNKQQVCEWLIGDLIIISKSITFRRAEQEQFKNNPPKPKPGEPRRDFQKRRLKYESDYERHEDRIAEEFAKSQECGTLIENYCQGCPFDNDLVNGVLAGLGVYGAYRLLRLAPSLLPPLWWTIPGNVAFP